MIQENAATTFRFYFNQNNKKMEIKISEVNANKSQLNELGYFFSDKSREYIKSVSPTKNEILPELVALADAPFPIRPHGKTELVALSEALSL